GRWLQTTGGVSPVSSRAAVPAWNVYAVNIIFDMQANCFSSLPLNTELLLASQSLRERQLNRFPSVAAKSMWKSILMAWPKACGYCIEMGWRQKC
ncbi:MAG TPA: hypothetical protein DEF45_16340, partial [Rhodopirellula sp.]|nr:hypothetical protein [Rhodopirellula sp.]